MRLKLHFTVAFYLLYSTAFSQPSLNNGNENSSDSYLSSLRGEPAHKDGLIKVDLAKLKKNLLTATLQKNIQSADQSVPFSILLPDGSTLKTSITPSPIWESKYEEQFKNIKTFMLTNPATKTSLGRIALTDKGISGIIFSDKGPVYINPADMAKSGMHELYYVKDEDIKMVACGSKAVEISKTFGTSAGSPMTPVTSGKRTFRLAVAATAEYTTWAGSQANALTYITITINNILALYQRDLNISFTIVSPNSILFTNAATDPYPGGNVYLDDGATNANQTAMDNILGTNAYDLGIVFNNGWDRGYVPAPFGFVCNPATKAKAAAGISYGIGLNPTAGPQGPVMDITVAHEIGHLFGATHSYASSAGFCNGFATDSAAFEPGAGSSLMSYGGYASCNAYVNYAEMYFHSGSIAQIESYIASSVTCVTPVATGNTPPVVTVASTSYNVPVSTPFTLSASGSDADGNTLIYNWEEMDANFLTPSPPAATNTAGPNFRSYPPVATGNIRTFPGIYDVAAGVSPPYEVLPSVSRTMNFRITARDQSSLGGNTAEANVALNFNSSAGPFKVTSQSSSVSWAAYSTQTVTWNVANTNVAPVSCASVNILFSIDGGITYPYTLVSNTANDGSQTITVPNLATTAGRIIVQSVNNVFFNINAANITVTGSCNSEGTTFTPGDSVTAQEGSASLNLSLAPQYGTLLTPSGTIQSSNPSTTLIIYNSSVPSCATYGYNASYKYEEHPFIVTTPGTYTFTPSNYGLIYNIYHNSFNPLFPCYNFIASNGLTDGTTTTINSTVTASLVPGQQYVIVAGTYSTTFPTLPFTYSVAVSGGNIYSAPSNPGSSYSYYFVIVDSATHNIKSISSTADLSNKTNYPGGNGYMVYGLSYSNSSPALSSFVGTDFNTFSNDLLFNAAYCGNLSKNSAKVTILSAPLPLVLSGFYGEVNRNSNNIYIEIQSVIGKMNIVIERSVNGTNFNAIGSFNLQDQNTFTRHIYTDEYPFDGKNYYRLKMIDQDGSFSYSKIILLEDVLKKEIHVYPNPANDFLSVDLSSLKEGKYNLTLTDVAGRKLYKAQPANILITIPLARMANGNYFLQVTDHDQNVLLMKKIVIVK